MISLPVILVFGAINQDEVVRVSHHPVPGETVVTDSIHFFQGGKGANQAYAAAIAGGKNLTAHMIGAVGDDAAGTDALASLHSVGVDTTLVNRVSGRPTGRAYTTVTEDRQNSIVVGRGANGYVSPSNLVAAQTPTLTIAQTELGSAATEALASFAASVGARLIINNGPVVALSDAAFSLADPPVVNQQEALDLLVYDGGDLSPEQVANTLRARYRCVSLIITVGGAGCVVADATSTRRHSITAAGQVVDTTEAGDTFVGSLAAGLAMGDDLDAAVSRASIAAAESVAWHGARALLSGSPDGPLARSSTTLV